MRLEADTDWDEYELPRDRHISSYATLLLQVLEPAHEQRAFAPAGGSGEQIPRRRSLIVQPSVKESDILVPSAKRNRSQPRLGDQILFEKFRELAAKL